MRRRKSEITSTRISVVVVVSAVCGLDSSLAAQLQNRFGARS